MIKRLSECSRLDAGKILIEKPVLILRNYCRKQQMKPGLIAGCPHRHADGLRTGTIRADRDNISSVVSNPIEQRH